MSVGASIIGALAGPRGPLAAAVIALALAMPSLVLPPLLDDHGFRFRLAVDARGPLETFCFGSAANDGFAHRGPWWFDPNPPRICFMRPLSGLWHWVDYQLWPDATLWMRAQNCLLYAALVALALLGYRRFGGSGRCVAFAGAMFALDEAHASVLATIAGRNTLLWPALALVSLLAHDAHRSSPQRRLGWIGPAALALALLAGEGGFSTLGYIAAYALCLDPDTRSGRTRSLLPYVVVAVLWAGVYVLLGYGAAENDFYRDPRRDPWGTLGSALLDLPVWFASQLTIGFATATFEAPPALVRIVAAALALLLGRLLWPVVRDSRVARFYATGFLLSLAPLLLTVPQDRLLVLASFGGFGLLGCLLDRAARSLAQRAARTALIGIHLVLAPLAFVPSYLLAGRLSRAEAAVDHALPRSDEAGTTGAVIVHAPILGSLAYALSKRRGEARPLPRYSYELFAAPSALDVTRIDEHTLELVPHAGYCSSRAECLGIDRSRPFRAGQSIELSNLRVEIRAIDTRGMPTRVRFHFPSPLEDPSRRWLVWTADGVRPFALPARAETLTLPALSPLSVFH